MRLPHGLGAPLGGEPRLAVDVEDAPARAGGVRGEEHPLEEPVRVGLHQMAVLEDPGLALLAVRDQVLRRAARGAAALPLHRGREVGAASAEEARGLHGGGDGAGVARVESAGEGGVAPRAERVVERARADRAPPLGEDALLAAEDRMRRVGPRRRREAVIARALEEPDERGDAVGRDALHGEARHAGREHLDDRLGVTEAAARAVLDRRGEPRAPDRVPEGVPRRRRAAREPAGAGGDEEPRRAGLALARAGDERLGASRARSSLTAPTPGPSRRRRGERAGHGHPGRQRRVGAVRGAAGREDRVGRRPAEVRVVHLDHGRDAAHEAAVGLLERHLTVGRRVPRRHTQALLELGKQPEASVHAAGDAATDADDVAPRRREAKLRIVSRDAVDLARRDVEVGGDRREILG